MSRNFPRGRTGVCFPRTLTIESRATTIRDMAIVYPLRDVCTPAELEHVQALMEGRADAQRSTFAILADVHLDRPEVLAGLRHMLTGLARADSVPAMFVLMGGFASRPFGRHPGDRALYTAGFEALAALLIVHSSGFVSLRRCCCRCCFLACSSLSL
jgi:hypothetical protein